MWVGCGSLSTCTVDVPVLLKVTVSPTETVTEAGLNVPFLYVTVVVVTAGVVGVVVVAGGVVVLGMVVVSGVVVVAGNVRSKALPVVVVVVVALLLFFLTNAYTPAITIRIATIVKPIFAELDIILLFYNIIIIS